MKADKIIGKKVIDTTHGSEIGKVSGLVIDTDQMRVAGLAVSGGGIRGQKYIPFRDLASSVEHDVVMVASADSLVDRGNLAMREMDTLESLTGKRALTEDGRELGKVESYDVNPQTGQIDSVTFTVSKDVLGGLWKSTTGSYDVPRAYVRTLGQVVVVDNSTPDVVGLRPAA